MTSLFGGSVADVGSLNGDSSGVGGSNGGSTGESGDQTDGG